MTAPLADSFWIIFNVRNIPSPLTIVADRFPKTLAETKAMAREMRPLCDVLFVSTMQGTSDDNGNPLSNKQVVPIITGVYAKPVVGGHKPNIKYGMLCGMTQSVKNRCATAAKMLLMAMGGTPVSEIPITRNQRGKAVHNVTVMKALGIKPKPIILKGAELVQTEL